MIVDSFCSPLDVIATPDEVLANAASRMRWNDVGCVAVLEDGGLVGILTERDLTRAIADGADPTETVVADYMSPDPYVISPETDAAEAARQMITAGVRHLPLVDNGRIVGVISMRDLLAETVWTSEVKR